jgi:hypothetical protein
MTNQTTTNRSYLQRIFWHLYPAITGRAFRLEDYQDEKVKTLLRDFEKKFMPDLDRMTKNKKGKSSGHKNQNSK